MGFEVVGFAEGEGVVDVLAEGGEGEGIGEGALLLGVAEALDELVFGEAEVDALGAGVDAVHGVGVTGGAAAGGDDHVVTLQHLAEGGVLQRPEGRLPVLLEEQRNGRVVLLLDVHIQVDERHTQPLGKLLADGALPGTGEADEDGAGHWG